MHNVNSHFQLTFNSSARTETKGLMWENRCEHHLAYVQWINICLCFSGFLLDYRLMTLEVSISMLKWPKMWFNYPLSLWKLELNLWIKKNSYKSRNENITGEVLLSCLIITTRTTPWRNVKVVHSNCKLGTLNSHWFIFYAISATKSNLQLRLIGSFCLNKSIFPSVRGFN